MKKEEIIVAFVTVYAIHFHALPFLGVADDVITFMFLLSPFLVIGMVIYVLKHGKASGYSFDERFYDDLDYTRNGKEQLDEEE